jgi:hypothetical protein
MRTRQILLSVIFAGATLVNTVACTDKPAPQPTIVIPSIDPSATPNPSSSATTNATAAPSSSSSLDADPGLAVCNDIQGNINASKPPLPTDLDASYYSTLKDRFNASKYDDVKKAGGALVDKYQAATTPGGDQPDANELATTTQDLLRACAAHE